MNEEQHFNTLLQFFKVLGNESRLKILGLLANDDRTVGELAALLDLREPTVSHHLAAMKELGLIDARVEGNNRVYWLNTQFLENMSRDLFSQSNLATLATDEVGDAWEDKVLRYYVADGRLKDIPSKHKKRLVVLQWLCQQFEPDRRYHELELNERLRAYHPDCASLRRYMVEDRLMARDNNNMYWRLV
ncbi:MAG TPA: metalloregulator ArsR/SmtB family transcription factor [Chloroflexota bacterium]|nr:metalloregulator ArsR/SmtB family transcription factor [Chloroflexota bacterium]